MIAFLKRMRWTLLLACYVVVAKFCRLFRITPPIHSFWRPHNLRRFRPYYVVPRVECRVVKFPLKRAQ
jgi:hypothetical protein